jgi:hypothetical protein
MGSSLSQVIKVASRAVAPGRRAERHRVRPLCQVALIAAAAGGYAVARDGVTEAMASRRARRPGVDGASPDRAVFHYLPPARGRARRRPRPRRRSALPAGGRKLAPDVDGAGASSGASLEAAGRERLEPLTDEIAQPRRSSCVQMRAWMQFGKDFDLPDGGSLSPRSTRARGVRNVVRPADRAAPLAIERATRCLAGRPSHAEPRSLPAWRVGPRVLGGRGRLPVLVPERGSGAIVGASSGSVLISGDRLAPLRSWTRRPASCPPPAGPTWGGGTCWSW